MAINKAYWKKEMAKLVKNARLPANHDDYISPVLVEELLWDIPSLDMSKKEKENWKKKLYEK